MHVEESIPDIAKIGIEEAASRDRPARLDWPESGIIW